MKRTSILCQLALVAAVVGCGPQTAEVTPPPQEPAASAPAVEAPAATDMTQTPDTGDASAVTFVSLKVPNMH